MSPLFGCCRFQGASRGIVSFSFTHLTPFHGATSAAHIVPLCHCDFLIFCMCWFGGLGFDGISQYVVFCFCFILGEYTTGWLSCVLQGRQFCVLLGLAGSAPSESSWFTRPRICFRETLHFLSKQPGFYLGCHSTCCPSHCPVISTVLKVPSPVPWAGVHL